MHTRYVLIFRWTGVELPEADSIDHKDLPIFHLLVPRNRFAPLHTFPRRLTLRRSALRFKRHCRLQYAHRSVAKMLLLQSTRQGDREHGCRFNREVVSRRSSIATSMVLHLFLAKEESKLDYDRAELPGRRGLRDRYASRCWLTESHFPYSGTSSLATIDRL